MAAMHSPAISARTMKSVMMVVRFLDHAAGDVVVVVVLVGIDRQVAACGLAKEGDVSRVYTHLLWMPTAADMLVEADDFIGGRHHQMQVVRDHQHATLVTRANIV